MNLKSLLGRQKIAQQIKVLAKTDTLSLIPGINLVEQQKQFPQAVYWPLCACPPNTQIHKHP